jgi:hypothetical protein
MAQGLSGSNASLDGDPTANLVLIELRAQSNLLLSLLGTTGAGDQIGTLRNDQAFELGIPTPLPGSGR